MSSNPLDYHVQQILDNQNYLTQAHFAALQAILPSEKPGERKVTRESGHRLSKQIENQLNLLERLTLATSESNDVGELKALLSASRSLYEMMLKSADRVRSEDKISALEQSIYDAFADTEDPETRKKFMEAWRARLDMMEKEA